MERAIELIVNQLKGKESQIPDSLLSQYISWKKDMSYDLAFYSPDDKELPEFSRLASELSELTCALNGLRVCEKEIKEYYELRAALKHVLNSVS